MENIIRYIDSIFDNFPVNSVSSKMRKDLIKRAKDELNLGISEDAIISQIASADKISTMIPNKHSPYYFVLWGISLALTLYIFNFISTPDFLQIFKPTYMEFPDIIEKCIIFILVFILAYGVIHHFYRSLPQKYITRKNIQSYFLIALGTFLFTLFLMVGLAFVWFTFNGFDPETITFSTTSTIIYNFYKTFFANKTIVCVYSVITAAIFVCSNTAYHLDTKPLPYTFKEIYQNKFDSIFQASTVTNEVVDFIKSETKDDPTPLPLNPAFIVANEVVEFIKENG